MRKRPMQSCSRIEPALLAVMTCSLVLHAQQQRPPAVPLIANDPSFSVWSMANKLTDAPTMHWSEAIQPMTGLIRIDGQAFRWMGGPVRGFRVPQSPAMQQESLEITPLHTRYRFTAAGIALNVTFFTPLLPRDLDVMSRPVTYLTWSAVSTDGKPVSYT